MTHRRLLPAVALLSMAMSWAVVPAVLVAPAPALAAECLPAADVPFPAVPWAQQRLAPHRAWELSRGDGVVVAVVDTGVSAAAPALAGRVLPGRDVRTDGRADSDCTGHGTFVAGLIAARGLPNTGFAGVAPDAVILPIRVAENFDDLHPDVLAQGIEAAIDGNASVIVVVPSAPFGSAALSSAVARAEQENRVLIASSTTQRTGGLANPAASRSVLSVAAIASDGEPMSTVGSDGTAREPDIAAPGTDLIGIAPTGPGNLAGSARCFATAFVAGAAALVRGYLPELTAAQVRDRLVGTADPGPPSARPAVGAGMVDPLAAVAAVDPVLPDEPGEPVAGPSPAVPGPQPATHTNGMPLAAGLVGAAAVGAVIAGLAATAATAARRRRTDASA